MSSPSVQVVLTSTFIVLVAIVGFLAYVIAKYTPIIGRIFEATPMFLPLRIARIKDGEEVRFRTRDGLNLVGTYFQSRQPRRVGVLVFCHEYLGDRWSVLPYADHLRDEGFDLFSFDFRNHGESQVDPAYEPLQWVTDHELTDLDAALTYLRSRPDSDPAGVGLFGVSRGGGTALCVAGRDANVWGVITDGAFPTRGTMVAYIVRWAEIYVTNRLIRQAIPIFGFDFLAWVSRVRTQARLRCHYANVERWASRLTPRPWLAIHGQRDEYIGLDIARKLFGIAGEPKELWIVEGAKHNRCRETEPLVYADRIASFVLRFAPRARREVSSDDRAQAPSPVALHQLPLPAELGVAISN